METNTQISKTPPFMRWAAVCFIAVFAVSACSNDSNDDNDTNNSHSSSEEETVEMLPAEEPYDFVGEDVAGEGQHAQRELLEERDPTLEDLLDAGKKAIDCGEEHEVPMVMMENGFHPERPLLTTDQNAWSTHDDSEHEHEIWSECHNAHMGLIDDTFLENLGPAVPDEDVWQAFTDCLDHHNVEYDLDATNQEEVEESILDGHSGTTLECTTKARNTVDFDDRVISLD